MNSISNLKGSRSINTHTYVILQVSGPTYIEIKELMMKAGYQHVVHELKSGEILDMSGIALQMKPPEEEEQKRDY